MAERDDAAGRRDVHALIDQFERDCTMPANLIEAWRTVALTMEDSDDDAQCAAWAELFRRMAEWYQSIGQADVAQRLRQLANDSAQDVQ